MRRIVPFVLVTWLALSAAALGWGWQGHTLISRAAALALPATMPDFIRTEDASDEIAALGPEPDRSKDAGKSHDLDRDPGHYADIGDDGKIAGVVDPRDPPESREAYDTALRAAGTDQYKMGFIIYSIVDGWEQIAKDFAIWRVDRVGERMANSADDRAWFEYDRKLRETLTLRDIGVWSHFVGDGSQPLHVSVHFNGWGDFPNPNGFTEARTTHAAFEGAFVRAHATLPDVQAKMKPLATSDAPIATQVGTYLEATAGKVVPFYTLEKAGAFRTASPKAISFTDGCLADGASELRDLIVEAYAASDTMKVGYPDGITPQEAEAGTVPSRVRAGGSD